MVTILLRQYVQCMQPTFIILIRGQFFVVLKKCLFNNILCSFYMNVEHILGTFVEYCLRFEQTKTKV